MGAHHRAKPRPWQPDWHVMRKLGSTLRAALAAPALGVRGARVLDFGCGTRPYEAWFAAAGARYHGADIGESAEIAVRADGSLAAVDGSFDIVGSFQVLEHVWDVATYLREARRVLRKDGRLLLSTHGTWLYHPHPGDYRRWTAEGLRREIEAQGFSMLRMWPIVGPLAWTTVLRNVGLAHLLRRIPVAGAALACASALALNACAWLEDSITPSGITANNACVYLALFRRAD